MRYAIWGRVMSVGCALALAGGLGSGCSLDDRDVNAAQDAAVRGSLADDGGKTMVPMEPDGSVPETGMPVMGGSMAPKRPRNPMDIGIPMPAPDISVPDEDGGLPDEDGGTTPTACALGNALIPDEGWIDGASNCPAIQGGLWVNFMDGSFIVTTKLSGEICAEGFSEITPPTAYDVGFGVYLNQADRTQEAVDYDADARGVAGVEFVLRGEVLPYFGVISDDTLYCTRLAGEGVYHIVWTDLRPECWLDASGPLPDPRRVRSIGFYSAATDQDPVAFQFCMKDLATVVPD